MKKKNLGLIPEVVFDTWLGSLRDLVSYGLFRFIFLGFLAIL
jgi:hypothetical protein